MIAFSLSAADECVRRARTLGTVDTAAMPVPLESNYLVPNGTFIVLIVLSVLVLIVVGLLVGGMVWLIKSRRGTTSDR